MKHKLVKALSLSRDEWWILTRAWILLLLVDLGLRILPFRRLQKVLTPKSRTMNKSQPWEVLAKIRHLRRWVYTAARNHLYPMTCLRRSLVLQRLLGQQGIEVDLQIGVRKEEEQFNAHAWLVYHDQPIGEPVSIAEHYIPLLAVEAAHQPHQPVDTKHSYLKTE
jgi:hypothetical protein